MEVYKVLGIEAKIKQFNGIFKDDIYLQMTVGKYIIDEGLLAKLQLLGVKQIAILSPDGKGISKTVYDLDDKFIIVKVDEINQTIIRMITTRMIDQSDLDIVHEILTEFNNNGCYMVIIGVDELD